MHLRCSRSQRRWTRYHRYLRIYSGEKISTLIKAAGINVEGYWSKLFAKALQGQDVASFFNFGGSVSSGPVASEAAKPAPVAEKKAEEKGGKK